MEIRNRSTQLANGYQKSLLPSKKWDSEIMKSQKDDVNQKLRVHNHLIDRYMNTR